MKKFPETHMEQHKKTLANLTAEIVWGKKKNNQGLKILNLAVY